MRRSCDQFDGYNRALISLVIRQTFCTNGKPLYTWEIELIPLERILEVSRRNGHYKQIHFTSFHNFPWLSMTL